ncbi:MAG: hypothetical protein AAGK78_00365 [Planctomycetota bacterium]
MSSDTATTSKLASLGWAFYLGCSWTWVIGMFLPVLLVRDFGTAGWVIFAIPNVVGAAAMGWVLKSQHASEVFCRMHRKMLATFTIVTVLFQAFTLGFLLTNFLNVVFAGLIGVGVWVTVLLASCAASLPQRLVAIAVWITSMVLAALYFTTDTDALSFAPFGVQRTSVASGIAFGDFLGLLSVCVLGFACCPYLDLTFHHARQNTSRGGAKLAFGVGFGVIFFAMIGFTLVYSTELPWLARASLALGNVREALPMIAWLLMIHLAIQVAFTCTVHLRQWPAVSSRTMLMVLASAVLFGVGMLVGVRPMWMLEREFGEQLYRCFLAFYGLVAPTYLLLVAIAGVSIRWWVFTMLAALPFFATGFLLPGMMMWSLPGVAVVGMSFALAAIASGGFRRMAQMRQHRFAAASAADERAVDARGFEVIPAHE